MLLGFKGKYWLVNQHFFCILHTQPKMTIFLSSMHSQHKHSLYIHLACLILFFSVVLFLTSCSREDPKLAIKQSLAELVTAVEQKSHHTFNQKMTRNFIGNNRLNPQAMTALIFRYVIRYRFVRIYTLVNSIEIEPESEGSRARMTFHVALTSSKQTVPERMRVYKVNAYWIIKNNKWKILKANWLEVRPQSFYPQIK